MTGFNLIVLDVKEINSENIRLTVQLSNVLDSKKPHEFDLSIGNPITDTLTQNILWIFENDERNTVHEKSVKRQIRNAGITLFDSIFGSSEFSLTKTKLEACFLRINCKQAFPWEILYDKAKLRHILFSAKGFSRSAKATFNPSKIVQVQAPIRVLLVVTRPFKFKDVHFRTISNLLFDLLSNEANYEVTVLRPATFKALEETLSRAKNENNPYSIVHFDGHGIHGSEKIGLNPHKGYIVFEDEAGKDADFIDGERIGDLLKKQAVNMLVLNACRSGYKQQVYEDSEAGNEIIEQQFTSFAEDAIRSGINALVAMRYKIQVEDAYAFMVGFYHELAAGSMVGTSFKTGATLLLNGGEENVLLPILYENDPVVFKKKSKGLLGLFKKSSKTIALKKRIPGFDDWIVRIDKIFQQHSLAILSGMEGSGKSSLAKEFGQWALDSNLSDALIFDPKESLEPVIQTIAKSKATSYFIVFKEPRTSDEIIQFKTRVEEINSNTKILYLAGYVDPKSPIGDFPQIHLNSVELELDGLENEIVNTVHNQTLELIFENYAGNPLTLKTLLKGIQTDKANVLVSDIWVGIDNGGLIERLKLNDFDAQFDRSEQQLLALLSLVGNQFDAEMFAVLIEIAGSDFQGVEKGLLVKAQQQGFLGWYKTNAQAEYQLHPLMKVYLFRNWEHLFEKETQLQLLEGVSQYLQNEMQGGNPFSREKFEKAAEPFLTCCLINKCQVDLEFWLTLLHHKFPAHSLGWKNLLDTGLKVYNPTNEVNFPNSISDKNFAVFAYYKKVYDLSMFDFVDTAEVAFFINKLLERKLILNPEIQASIDAFIWMTKLAVFGAEAAINNAKVQPYSRITCLAVIEQLNYLENILVTLSDQSAKESLAKILNLRAEYHALKINNYMIWMLNLSAKKKELTDNEFSNPIIPFYLENVNEEVHHSSFGLNQKHANEALRQKLFLLANFEDREKNPLTDQQLNDLETVILGYQFKEEFEKAGQDFKKASDLTNDLNRKDFIAFEHNRMIRNVRGKLLYCLLDGDEIEKIGQSGLFAELDKVERVVDFTKKEMNGKALDLWNYVNKHYPIIIASDLDKEVGEMKKMAYTGEFDNAILSFEEIRKKIGTNSNIIKATVFEAEFLIELMVNTNLEAEIKQFETPISIYIDDSIDEIRQRLMVFEYLNSIRQPDSVYQKMEDWMGAHLKELESSNSTEFSNKYTGEIGGHISDRLSWVETHNELEEEAISEAFSFLMATVGKMKKYFDEEGTELEVQSEFDHISAWVELDRLEIIKEKKENLIRFTIEPEYEDLLELGEYFYLIQLGVYEMSLEQRIKWTGLAQNRIERDKEKMVGEESEEEGGLKELLQFYQDSIARLMYEQGRLGLKRIAPNLKNRLLCLAASKLVLHGLENHCKNIYSEYLKQLFKEELSPQDAHDAIHNWSLLVLFLITDVEDHRPLVKEKWIKIAREMFQNIVDFMMEPAQKDNRPLRGTVYELSRHWDVIELILISKNEEYAGTVIPADLEKILNRLEMELSPKGKPRLSDVSEFKSKLLRGRVIRNKIWNLTQQLMTHNEEQLKQREDWSKEMSKTFKSDTQLNIYE